MAVVERIEPAVHHRHPAGVRRQVLGVADPSMAEKMARVLAARGAERVLVVHGDDGLDELTTTTKSKIWQVSGGEVVDFELDPTDFGIKLVDQEVLVGGDAHFNAEVARSVFANQTSGNLGAVRDIVVLNAAAGVVTYELAKDSSRSDLDPSVRFQDAIERVTRTLESGAAAAKLSDWITATQR